MAGSPISGLKLQPSDPSSFIKESDFTLNARWWFGIGPEAPELETYFK